MSRRVVDDGPVPVSHNPPPSPLWIRCGRLDAVTAPDLAACCTPVGDPALDEAAAEVLVSMLKALADPVRLRLINLIAQTGEVCACDLPAALDRSQPTVSHHLKVLVDAGLIDREQRGKWAWFTVRTEQLQALGAAIQLQPAPTKA